jgi:hypothetical protein
MIGMRLNAAGFIQNRPQVVSITNNRISNIIWYIAECYNMLLSDKVCYSKSKTTFHFEDYLKMEFVDSYLINNKKTLTERISALEHINFSYETQKRYLDQNDKKEKIDKIDIFINKLGLKNEWSSEDEHLYLAIECKRIKTLSDCTEYIKDIQKFCDRAYKHLRIPFEGVHFKYSQIKIHNL